MKLKIGLAVLFASVLRLSAWDVSGHIIVAKIAYDHTSDHARKKMDELGPKLTFFVETNGQLVKHPYNGVSLAAWPDNIKHAEDDQSPYAGRYGDWHFLDLGLKASNPNPFERPEALGTKSGDAYQGLQRAISVVKKHTKRDPLVPSEEIALALICHIVGDIHQPLHCTTNYHRDAEGHMESDIGGNAVAVRNFKDRYAELHQFWDVGYRMGYDAQKDQFEAPKGLSTFSTKPNSPDLEKWAALISKDQADVDVKLDDDYLKAWIEETHREGVKVAYGKIGENYNDNSVKLTKAYGDAVITSTRRQMYVAGLRLAALLKSLYP